MTTTTNRMATHAPTIRDEVERRLLAGEDAAAVGATLGLDVVDGAVVLPGWLADDGNAEVEIEAASGREAAETYVADGDWGDDDSETSWVRVRAWQVGLGMEGSDLYEYEIGSALHTVAIDPPEPACVDGDDHDWQSPHEIVGGCAENPGVHGNGGGVVIVECCMRCGCQRTTDTWAQDRSTGEQGLDSVSYDEGYYRDEIARAQESAE